MWYSIAQLLVGFSYVLVGGFNTNVNVNTGTNSVDNPYLPADTLAYVQFDSRNTGYANLYEYEDTTSSFIFVDNNDLRKVFNFSLYDTGEGYGLTFYGRGNYGFDFRIEIDLYGSGIHNYTYFSPVLNYYERDLFDYGFPLSYDAVNSNNYFFITFFIYPVNENLYNSAQGGDYYEGYDYGYDNGYNDGYANGVNENGTSSYNIGYSSGYNEGYRIGVNATNQYTFGKFFGAIADVPILYVRNLLGFEIFGVQAITILMSMITACLVLYLLRKVIF